MIRQNLIEKILLGVLIATFSVAAITLVAKVIGPLPFSVSQVVTDQQVPFSVTGETQVETVPDEAQVRLGISVLRRTVADSQNQANQVINSITDQLQSQLGIDKADIKTQNYSIYPEYSRQPIPLSAETTTDSSNIEPAILPAPDTGDRQISGYRVTADIVVEVTDFEKLNQAIDLATAQGANQVGGIQFNLSDDKRKELIRDAREEAIADAQDKAQELARLSGMRLGKVVNVSEGPSYQPPIFYDTALRAEGAAVDKAPTQIEPGTTSFTYSVTVSYQTL